jgi:hypothetical protein
MKQCRIHPHGLECFALLAMTMRGCVTPSSGDFSATAEVNFRRPSNVANFSPHEAPAGTDEDCAICAIAHLANAAVLSAPSILPLPVHFGEAQYRGAGLAPSAEIPLRAFQARAPPLV